MSKDGLRIQYYPALETEEELQEQLARACWYLSALDPAAVVIPTSLKDTTLRLADYYDQSISSTYEAMMTQGVFDFPSPEAVRLEDADVVVCWKGKGLLGEQAKKLEGRGVRVFDVDRTHRMEGSLYIDIVDKVSGGQKEAIQYGSTGFARLAEEHKNATKAYIFCTGPSVAEYPSYEYQDAVSIVCNSVIHDHELMDYVRPSIHVFADPIFHFGCSSYASEFRRSLVAASAKYDLTHIIPLKYWSLFTRQFPELVDCSFPVPFDQKIPVNYSLGSDFRLKTTDNILTFLMLPVAGSLASEIYLLGCDGRPLSEDDYFWKHNEKTQFVDEMASIQLAHPSFFKLDYNEYYVRHCERLEEYFQAGEALGKRFVSLTFSHIPALVSREDSYRFANDKDSLVVGVNPDLTNAFGHFYNMDRRVEESLSSETGFASLAAKEIESSEGLASVIPTFSDNTWHIRDSARATSEIETRFKNELIRSAINMRRLPVDKALYMYTADILHLRAILEGRKSFAASQIHLHINLFFSSFDIFSERFVESESYRTYAQILDSYHELAPAGISLYVESPIVQGELLRLFGVTTRLWPMIGVTAPRSLEAASASRSGNAVPVVFFPATTQFAKGADLACEAIIRYNETFGTDAKFVLRDFLNDRESSNAKLRVMLDAVAKYDNVELVEGALSEREYASLYAQADVVVVPYARENFYARTSAAVVDALYFGCPVVVTDDTWLSRETEKFAQNFTFADKDDFSLARSVRDALAARKRDPRLPVEHRDQWLETYSAQSLTSLFSAETEHGESGSAAAQSELQKAPPPTSFVVGSKPLYQPLEESKFSSLQGQLHSLGEQFYEITSRMLDEAALLSQVESKAEQVNIGNAQSAAQIGAIHDRLNEIATPEGFVDNTTSSIAEVRSNLASISDTATSSIAQVRSSLADISARFDETDVKLDALRAELEGKSEAIRGEIEQQLNQLTTYVNAPKSNRDLYQRFSRQVTGSDLNTFVTHWFPKLGLDMKPHVLAYEAELICEAEKRCAGRLASSVQDALLRSLVARAVSGPSLEYLEIGTLFGINLCTVHELAKYEFSELKLTSIDPLENYYQQGRDVLTGLPINSEVVGDNVRAMNIASERIRFIQMLSTEPEAIRLAGERTYNCILIDGDHSYEGVKHDHEHFSGMLSPGGYLMVDDYGAEEWPDVTRYVDETIKADSRFEFVGSSWRTAVFRGV